MSSLRRSGAAGAPAAAAAAPAPVASAPVAGGTDGHTANSAKKRRRWSTVQEEVVVPNRFGRKKQLRLLGRQLTSSSTNSLASFQSNSNPIFEPSAPCYSSNNPDPLPGEDIDGVRPGATKTFQSHWNNNQQPRAASLTTAGGSLGRGEGAEQPHPSGRRFHAQDQQTHLDSSPPKNDCGSWGGAEDDGTENPPPLLLSPTSYGGVAYWASEESRETSRSCFGGYDEMWPVDKGFPNEKAPVPTKSSSADGGQSIDGPRHLDIVSQQGPDEEEQLSSLESCHKRSRELVEKVQANAAAELAQLTAYRGMIDHLRGDCAKYEAAAKQQADLYQATVIELHSVRDEKCELESERDEFKEKLVIVEMELRDAKAITADRDWKADLGTMEERDGWRKKVETLDRELSAMESDRDAMATSLRDVRKELRGEQSGSIQNEENNFKVEVEGNARIITPLASIAYKAVEAPGAQVTVDNGEIEAGSRKVLPSASVLSSEKLVEVQSQLSAVCKEMEKLQKERNDLRIAVLDGEKRVEEAQQERDAVVLAVQGEWDAVKVALREEKKKLENELEAVREQKTKLESELDSTRKQRESSNSQNRENGRDLDMQIATTDKRMDPGSERGQKNQRAVRDENKKLEIELVETRNHNNKLERERAALIATLIGVRDGNKKLEGELIQVRDESTELEREREALVILREERKKLEGERAVIFKAMRGENKKLESEREVLIAMQAYLTKLEMKQDLVNTVGGDEKRRRQSKQDTKPSELLSDLQNVKMLDNRRDAIQIQGR